MARLILLMIPLSVFLTDPCDRSGSGATGHMEGFLCERRAAFLLTTTGEADAPREHETLRWSARISQRAAEHLSVALSSGRGETECELSARVPLRWIGSRPPWTEKECLPFHNTPKLMLTMWLTNNTAYLELFHTKPKKSVLRLT